MVVYKATNNKIWVADPALGKVEYSKKEFCSSWYKSDQKNSNEGVILLLEKTDRF